MESICFLMGTRSRSTLMCEIQVGEPRNVCGMYTTSVRMSVSEIKCIYVAFVYLDLEELICANTSAFL